MLAHMVQALATKDFFSSLLGPCEISLCVCVCVCVLCVFEYFFTCWHYTMVQCHFVCVSGC